MRPDGAEVIERVCILIDLTEAKLRRAKQQKLWQEEHGKEYLALQWGIRVLEIDQHISDLRALLR